MNENTLNEIVRLWRGGSSRRRIARQLGISRYQVDRVIRAHEGGRREGTTADLLPRAKRKRASCLDDYEASLAQLRERYLEITAIRAHEELRKLGFAGGYNVVKRRLGVSGVRPGSRN